MFRSTQRFNDQLSSKITCLFLSTAHVSQQWPSGDQHALSPDRRAFPQLRGAAAAARRQLPAAQNHREGQLRQGQTGPTHPHGQRGETDTNAERVSEKNALEIGFLEN